MAFSTKLFSGPGVKEIDDFGETSRINATFLGDSVEFDAKKHKVRCRRNCLKGLGSKSEVSTGTKYNIRIRRTSGVLGGRVTCPKHGGSSKGVPWIAIVYRKPLTNLRNRAGELRRANGSNMSKK